MLNLLGEYKCKIDVKGRLMFPARLRRQLELILHHGLVVNRDIFEDCLVIYPQPEWDKVNNEMSRLSRYNRKHQLFQRKFMKGATHVELDGSGRVNLPALLLEHAGIDVQEDNEVIVSGLGERKSKSGARRATANPSWMTLKILTSVIWPKKYDATSNRAARTEHEHFRLPYPRSA